MSRKVKQALAATARNMADSDSFVPVVILANENVEQCTKEKFLDIISHIDELCENKTEEERPIYVEKIYNRMINILSQKTSIPLDKMICVIKQFVNYYPSKSILTFDDLKQLGITMERRSIIIHFDMSGSMSGSGFAPLIQTVIRFCSKLQTQGLNIYVSLFGGDVQETIHKNLGNRLLTFDEFSKGNYTPQGGTAFCPSFERTKQFPTPYDAIIISDGEFTDNVSRLTFQEQCKTVFFVAPPWSPVGVEEKHAKSISSCVHTNVPYIGITSQKYSELDNIIEGYIRQHDSFVNLSDYVIIGNYIIPSYLLAPTQMGKVFTDCIVQGETILELFVKKLLGLFRYLEETAKLNFERCLRGLEFQNIMSLVIPLTKICYGHLETSLSCQQLYGYLSKILNFLANEKQKLIKNLYNDEKSKSEINKFWESAMNFSERSLIIEENEKKYGKPIGYLNLRVPHLTCTCEMLYEALQELKTIYAPQDRDHLLLILDILSSCKIDEKIPKSPENTHIPVWRQPDGTVNILSILRLFPSCLQQLQHYQHVPLDSEWTLQPMTATRLAWIMDASNRTFPDFIKYALTSFVRPNKNLTDIDNDENRSTFWMKIIRELAQKVDVSQETLQSINQILTVHVLKGFSCRLTDGSVTFQKQIYENVSPFIDTDQPMAWCVFTDENGNRLDSLTGKIIESTHYITDPTLIHQYYQRNVSMHGSLVRPRYLTLMENPNLSTGAIELYQTCAKKDVEILRDQLELLGNGLFTSDQMSAHIHTIRDKAKCIPCVIWGSSDQINETVNKTKMACQGATIPTETIVINIPRSAVMDYLISHCDNPFIAGVLQGFIQYNRSGKEQSATGVSEIDYAIQAGENTKEIPSYETNRFNHFHKPGVQQYFEKFQKKFKRSLQSVMAPPQLSSLTTLLEQAQSETTANNEILGMADLESIPTTTTVTKKPAPTVLNKDLFTCPITLDIMDNPATTTPCGHMFEMDAIQDYLKRANNICPICRTGVTNVSPNYAFKSVIIAWNEQQN